MCAIIAWYGKMNNTVLRALFRHAQNWGEHSVGLAYINDGGQTEVFKRAISPEKFLKNHNNRTTEASLHTVGFGHVRYATHGNIVDKNAHPFQHGDVTFAHNGVISNYREIARQEDLNGLEVDSECLGPLIVKKELSRSFGSTGVVWISDRKLFVYRHSQGLEAYKCLIDGKPVTIVASRPSIVEKCDEDGILTILSHIRLDEYKAYTVTADGLELAWESAPAKSSSSYGRYGLCGGTPSAVACARPEEDECDDEEDEDDGEDEEVSKPSKKSKDDECDDEEDEDDGDGEDEGEDGVYSEVLCEEAANRLAASYTILILTDKTGQVSIFANSVDKLFDAVCEFVTMDSNGGTLTGATDDGGDWSTTTLSRWTSDSTIDYRDESIRIIAESILNKV